MKIKSSFVIFVLFLLMFSSITSVSAVPNVTVYTEKEIYSYGDILTFTIEVTEISGELAILHIIDEFGKSSSSIPIPISETKTVIPSPYPFESTVYPEGKYTIDVEYSGATATTEFELIDSGKVVIPFWIKDFSRYWITEQISDIEFVYAIEFLIREKIIIIPEVENQEKSNEIKIPQWIKTSTTWWLDRKISDHEYALSLEYLIKAGIIVV